MKKIVYIEEIQCSKCQYFSEGTGKYYYNYCKNYKQRIDCNPNELIPNFCKLDKIYSKKILSSCYCCIFHKDYEISDDDDFDCNCRCKKYNKKINECIGYSSICSVFNGFPKFCELEDLNE